MPARYPSRRETLVGAAATVAACTGPGGDSAALPEAATIDTIIFVMMENRSFDHYLGSLSLVEGRSDVDGLVAGMSNPDSDGVEHAVAPASVDCLADPGHSWGDSHRQFNEGANDGFVLEYESRAGDSSLRGEVMNYQVRENLPITYALADAYAVCDRWFCSVMGPTWPNRFYAHAGTSDGATNNDFPDGGAFTFPTLWSTLDAAGVAWKYYYTDLPFIGLFEGALRPENSAYFEDFLRDAERGDLPPVVWVDPGFSYNDDHPPHHPGLGQEFLAMVYKAVAASPQWGRCLLVITYDEHGGFHDHVAPPTTDDDRIDEGFDQLGFRVPTLLIGPYVRPGVDHTQYDHTSWLKYVCERFGLDPWTARIRAANSIGGALDTDRMSRGEAFEPAEVPAFDIDDSAVGPECGYGGPPTSGEDDTDLARWIRQYRPELDRTASVAAVLSKLRKG